MEKKEYIAKFAAEFVKVSGLSIERGFEAAEEYYAFLIQHEGEIGWPEVDARDEIRAFF